MLGLEAKTLIWTRDSHTMNLGLSALPSVSCVSYLCERDGVGKRFKVTQLGRASWNSGLAGVEACALPTMLVCSP